MPEIRLTLNLWGRILSEVLAHMFFQLFWALMLLSFPVVNDLKMILEIRDLLDKIDILKILSVCGYDQLYIENENASELDAKCFCTIEFSKRHQKSFKWVIIKVNISR